MNILITGGSDFLGRQSTLELLNLDHHIILVSKNPNKITILNNVKVIDYNILKTLSTPIDVIINLAGAGITDKRWSNKQKRRIFDSRIHPALAILDFIKNNLISLLIIGSAIGYYGVSDNAIFDENSSPICRDFARELRQTWKNLALSATDISATKVAIIRTGVVLDPNGNIHIIPTKDGLAELQTYGIDELTAMNYLCVLDDNNAMHTVIKSVRLLHKTADTKFNKLLRFPVIKPLSAIIILYLPNIAKKSQNGLSSNCLAMWNKSMNTIMAFINYRQNSN